ncbi:MAG: Histidine kinase-, DNA gyrase B-, and HSP90-like ATPase [Phormidium sp. OSCR]|nr:MAG: Histidine kinase-, DNA gyrase B-, and HSP90-like ATPase [Phormidium sp. OSCR]
MSVLLQSISQPQLPEETPVAHLSLDSTLDELKLHQCNVSISCRGEDVMELFNQNPLLPGVILTQNQEFVGVLSRRRLLEHMSQIYSIELFSRRPIASLYHFAGQEVFCYPSHTLIVMAARRSLQRPPDLLYEPILVEVESGEYHLLDVHQLLVAQSHIHQLTTQLLHEQTRQQMMQTEKMSSLGRMVAGVAHEFRNPVNCINGNMSFLQNYFQDLLELVEAYEAEDSVTEEVQELKENLEFEFLKDDLPKILQTVRESAERLTKIVGSLHGFSHMGEDRYENTNLETHLDNTLLILNNRLKTGITVQKNYHSIPDIYCASGQLNQVFMNLLSNAIDAVDEVKQLGKEPIITLTTQQIDEKWVSIIIEDNGPGIPEKIQNRIFENFFTTKPAGKGTGLGLAISHQIVVDNHHGQLSFSSTPGEGTAFEMRLPIKPVQA